MISRSSPFLAALRLTHTQLGSLAVIFIGSTFTFSFTEHGITFILWEHRPAIGIFLATIQQVADRNMFVTLAYVLLDNARSVARIATAGHPPVCVLRKGGTLEEVRSRSLGLGMQRDGRFTEVEMSVAVGDRLFLYTDGVTEATDDSGAQFDLSGLHSSLQETSRFGATESSQTVIDSVRRFMGSDEFRDDATVVSIRLPSSKT